VANKIRNTTKVFHAPVLPFPPAEYNQALTSQRDATLRFYFKNIDEALSQALQYDSDDIIDGSIPNSKLENSTVSFGGVTVSLGGSDATPAFNLADATGYPAGSLTGEIATAQIADDAVTDAKLANSINTAISANSAKVTNATHTGEVTGATALTIADGAVVTARIADDAVTGDKIAHNTITATNMNTSSVPATAIQTSAVTTSKIADANVTTAKIADDAVTGAKIDGTTTVTAASVVVTPDGSSASSVLKLKATNNYTAELHFGDVADDDAGRIQYNNFNNSMGFFINNSQKAVFRSDGDLLIGTTSSGSYGAKLRVAGIAESTGLRVTSNGNQFLQAGNYGAAGIELRSYTSYSSSAQLIMKFANSSGSEFGSIKITGASTSFNTSSDERLKENIRDADDAGAKIDAIKIRQFDWLESGEHQDYGFVAQELLPVAPEAVSEGYTADDMMSVDYSKLVPTLVKEIQSLRKRVEELENDK